MVGVLLRATGLMVLAPPTPVAWWPGARTLPDSVLRRLPRAMGRIAMPVDGGRPVTARVVVPPQPEPMTMTAPWGEPLTPFAGVTVSTRQVPLSWLRPEPPAGRAVPMPIDPVLMPTHVTPTVPAASSRHAIITKLPRAPRTMPQAPQPPAVGQQGAIGRFRRAAALAVGLLVSLVAVEAAARSGRR